MSTEDRVTEAGYSFQCGHQKRLYDGFGKLTIGHYNNGAAGEGPEHPLLASKPRLSSSVIQATSRPDYASSTLPFTPPVVCLPPISLPVPCRLWMSL